MYNEFLTKAAECYTLQSMQKKRTKMKQTIFMKDEKKKKTMPKWQKPGCASSGAIFTDTVGHCAKNGAFHLSDSWDWWFEAHVHQLHHQPLKLWSPEEASYGINLSPEVFVCLCSGMFSDLA